MGDPGGFPAKGLYFQSLHATAQEGQGSGTLGQCIGKCQPGPRHKIQTACVLPIAKQDGPRRGHVLLRSRPSPQQHPNIPLRPGHQTHELNCLRQLRTSKMTKADFPPSSLAGHPHTCWRKLFGCCSKHVGRNLDAEASEQGNMAQPQQATTHSQVLSKRLQHLLSSHTAAGKRHLTKTGWSKPDLWPFCGLV